jgi:hypothetical protein
VKYQSFKKPVARLTILALVASMLLAFSSPASASITRDGSDGLDFTGETEYVLYDRPLGNVGGYTNIDGSFTDVRVTVSGLENSYLSSSIQHGLYFDRDRSAATDQEKSMVVMGIKPETEGVRVISTYRVDFFNQVHRLNEETPVVFENLSVHAYDIDGGQYIELSNVKEYRITEDSALTVTDLGSGAFRFSSSEDLVANTNPSSEQVHSQGESRVQVVFQPTSSITMTFSSLFSGTQQFHFSPTGLDWVTKTGPISTPPLTSATRVTAPTPVVAAIDVNPTNITVDNEIITILGANLNTVTDVFIGGVRVPIFTQTGNRLQVRAPKGLSGLVDLELKSSLNDVLMTKKLNFGGVAAAGTRKATLIVGGFAHNSRKLTPRMKNRIDRWLTRNSDLGTLTCTGFTSLPRRTTDVTLSANRGLTACNFSKRQRADLETSVSQGIEDPRPGSNVRRVRLVLTQ